LSSYRFMLDKIIAVEYYWLQGNSDSRAV